MSEKSVDISPELGYNVGNDDDYASLAGIDQPSEVVDMAKQKPIHDTECGHETLVANPEDTLGDAVYHGCANPECIVGFYIRQR